MGVVCSPSAAGTCLWGRTAMPPALLFLGEVEWQEMWAHGQGGAGDGELKGNRGRQAP